MRRLILGSVFAATATGAFAQQETALEIALRQDPVPCGGEAFIASAAFEDRTDGARTVRVRCTRGAAVAPEGAPATNVVPLLGALAPALGIGAAAAAVAAAGAGGGSSTPDTQ